MADAARVLGLIFDLDGTLVDSRLDFDQMRLEMGLPAGAPILESLRKMPDERREDCLTILHAHEERGAEQATLMPGARDFLLEAEARGLCRGVLTRNLRRTAERTLERLEIEMGPIVGRHDAPCKPDPAGILHIRESWNLQAEEVVMVGDFHFDLAAGRRAGARTVLYARPGDVEKRAGRERPDFVLHDYRRADDLWRWLDGEQA